MRRTALRVCVTAFSLLMSVLPASAAPDFPALSGRVVDGAHLLSSDEAAMLEAKLAALETHNGDQLVVVTVPSLQGQAIEEYGYRLGRFWGIGQKGKNNGALLIVAPKEHKVRIEVGYGLEGTLTDADTSAIIQSVILPEFKKGAMAAGILDGADRLIKALGGEETATPRAQAPSQEGSSALSIGVILLLLFLFSQVVLFVMYLIGSIVGFILGLFGFSGLSTAMQNMRAKIFPADRALLFWLLMPSGRFTGSGGGSFRGGFSGGGGSFGGGGSSGSW